MFSAKSLAAATAVLSLFTSTVALYNPDSKANLGVYWGQGADEASDESLSLAAFCRSSSVDIIPLGFVSQFAPQGNGLPSLNLRNSCWLPFRNGPGYNGVNNPNNNLLPSRCPKVQRDIPICQALGKKIILSLGGAGGQPQYQLTGAKQGEELADFLWGAYGPFNQSWVNAGGIRPLDRGLFDNDESIRIEVDGFDFDIEFAPTDSSVGYIACINRLRQHFATQTCKKYLITGAPQCPDVIPAASTNIMSNMISKVKFDILFIQFYNNGAFGCNAAQWATRNDRYNATKTENEGAFNFNFWTNLVNLGKSAGAKIYLGLLAGPGASDGAPNDYLQPYQAKNLIDAYQGKAQFGGVMLWEAENSAKYIVNGKSYHENIKSFLNPYAPATTQPATVCSSTTSSTRSSTTTTSSSSRSTTSSSSRTTTSSSTRSTTSSSSRTTTSSSTRSTTSSSSRSTTSSTSQSTTSSSSRSTTSSSTRSTTSSSSSSSRSTTSSSTRSTTSSTSTTSSSISTTSSSQTTSSTSSSVALTTSSSTSTSSTSVSSTSSTSSTIETPTTVPSVGQCTFLGCFTEATNSRALIGATLVDYEKMSVEICANFCKGFSLFGVEYGGECYCGDELQAGSVLTATGECNQVCAGTPSEFCGAGNRLDVYQCPLTTASSSTSTSASSSTASSAAVTTSSSSATVTTSSSSTSVATTSSSSSSTRATTSSSSVFSIRSSSTFVSTRSSTTARTSTTSLRSSSTSQSSRSSSSSSRTSSRISSSATTSRASSINSIGSSTTTSRASSTHQISSSATTSRASSTHQIGSSATTSRASTNGASSGATTSSGNPNEIAIPSSSSQSSLSSPAPTKSTSTAAYTTSTLYATSVYTITSCPPTVTNCATYIGHVTTQVITYTTVCPVSATSTNGPASPTLPPASSPPPSTTKFTTSTVCATSVYTITSCAPTVTDCPAQIGKVITTTVSLYTTVYPVVPSNNPPPIHAYSPAASDSTSTRTSSLTSTKYVTAAYVPSTVTQVLVPTPLAFEPAPYPTVKRPLTDAAVVVMPMGSAAVGPPPVRATGYVAGQPGKPGVVDFDGAGVRIGTSVGVVVAALVGGLMVLVL